MNFQTFKDNLEEKLKDKITFELLEFQYTPYSFGSGRLAYRINGYNYRLTYDGKENELTCEQSKPHEKYFGCSWTKVLTLQNLDIEKIERILLS